MSLITMSAERRERVAPFLVAVPFTTVITGYFTLPERLPLPIALPVAALWSIALGLAAAWIGRRARLAAWLEDAVVTLAVVAVAFAACGGLMAILTYGAALDSPSLTGETLVAMFLPSIPYFIVTNGLLELLIVPVMIYLCWRPGPRRVLVVVAALLYFALRVWTYLAFVPNRLAFAALAGSPEPFTAAGRQRAYLDLQVDDPRWAYLLVILAILLVAAQYPRRRDLPATR